MPTRASPARPSAAQLRASFTPHLQALCQRTAQALRASGHSGLLVSSGSLLPILADDRTYPYEVNAPFRAWTPLRHAPGSFVWFEPGATPRLIVHSPEDYWHQSAQVPDSYWITGFDLHTRPDRARMRELLPRDLAHAAYLGEGFPELTAWGIGAVNPRPLIDRLDYARAEKSPYELLCLREASRLAARAHRAAADAFHAGAGELGIELAFLAACGQREQELPYSPIIALNAAGAVLHYQLLESRPPDARHSLLIDAGCGFAGYPSDITRTYSAQDPDFAALIAAMDRMQQRLCAQVRAGVDWRDIHLKSHEYTGELLREAGLTRCGTEEAVATGVTQVFFPHGIGHLLGITVHDAGGRQRGPEGGEIPPPPGHPHLRLTRVLQENFVVTMEPGIYFIESLLAQARADARGRAIHWDRVGQLAKFGGIRIEDDLVVTRTGCENLTRDAFRQVDG